MWCTCRLRGRSDRNFHEVGSPPNCLDKGLAVRTWRLRADYRLKSAALIKTNPTEWLYALSLCICAVALRSFSSLDSLPPPAATGDRPEVSGWRLEARRRAGDGGGEPAVASMSAERSRSSDTSDSIDVVPAARPGTARLAPHEHERVSNGGGGGGRRGRG